MVRRCKQCKTELPAAAKCTDIIQKKGYCSTECLIQHTKAKNKLASEKKQRKEIREAKQRLKSRSDWMKEAQQAFNAYIRQRDSGKPCISCGSMPNDSDLLTGSRIDAGHYRSVGACPELRFEEMNCHAQCVKCNRNLSGNAVEYRIRLIKRIGLESVELLEKERGAKKYTIDDLKAIRDKYRKLKREMEALNQP